MTHDTGVTVREESPARLRIGVYNLAGGKDHGAPDDMPRLRRLLAKIFRMNCDLVGLVEVRASPPGSAWDPSEHIASEAKKAGYNSCFGAALSPGALVGPAPTEPATSGIYQGNMLLSRYPITRYHSFLISDFIRYEGGRDTEPRHLLLARVTITGDMPLYIGVTHLHTSVDRDNPKAGEVRAVQCERILHILNDLPGSEDMPLVLVGDFNNNPFAHGDDPEPEIRVLLRQLQDLSRYSGPTRIRRNPLRKVRIDRIFGNRLTHLAKTHRDRDPVDSNGEMFLHEGMPLSDHRPVVLTVEVRGLP